jgi:hypothetical protein
VKKSGRTLSLIFLTHGTESGRLQAQEEAQEAVRRSAESRAVIEQAKGALVAVFGIDADSAFALLRVRSQNGNIKLRDVAGGLVQQLAAGSTGTLTPQQRVSAYLHVAPSPDAGPARISADGWTSPADGTEWPVCRVRA